LQIKFSFQKSLIWAKTRIHAVKKRPYSREIRFINQKNLFFKKIELILREFFYVLNHTNISTKSAQITYTFILSIVPFLAIVFTFIHSLNGFENILAAVFEPIIKRHFGEPIGDEISGYLQMIVKNIEVKELGIISFCTFSVTVVLLLLQIEDIFDDILGIQSKNNLFQRLIKCWIIISLSPFLFALASLKSDSLIQVLNLEHLYFFEDDVAKWVRFSIGMAFQSLVFILAYYLLPSKRLHLKSVIIGGIIASILFEILKYVNIYLVKSSLSADPNKIYGTMPLIAVLFFVWIRFVWIVTLAGAGFSIASQRILYFKKASIQHDYPAKDMMICIVIYCAISRKYKLAGSPLTVKTISKITNVPPGDVQKWIDYLVSKHIIFKSLVDHTVTYFPSYHSIMEENKPESFLKDTLFSHNKNEMKNYTELISYYKQSLEVQE
jgi:membrane protein